MVACQRCVVERRSHPGDGVHGSNFGMGWVLWMGLPGMGLPGTG